ncbi:MAG: glycerate kinase [Lachnospiraceae bacterium]
MKIVIAMDSFKGSLTSMEAGYAAARGICRADHEAKIAVRPLADGGEGTVSALIEGMGGTLQTITVTGPLGKPVECSYGIIAKTGTAVLEMSAAAGLTLIPENERNPLKTTTYGVGEMIKDAVLKGCRRFLVGIGGSGTNDGGAGMLQALGYDLLNRDGQPILSGAEGLKELCCISVCHVMPELAECKFLVACDVTNPLCGQNGCSAVYGPQKGADREQTLKMDQWLFHYGELAKQQFPHTDLNYPGAGAAGGMGFAFLTFTNAELKPGIDIVLKETNLEEYLKDADLLITGEGQIDGQTAMGKAPAGAAKLAKQYKVPVAAFGGNVTKDGTKCNEQGIDALFSIVRGPISLTEAMDPDTAKENLSDAAEQVFRLVKCFAKSL